MTTETRKYTISEIKAANKEKGGHYFDPETMRFFNSKTESSVYSGPGGVFFITSEQFVGSNGIADPRKYSVRRFDPETGDCTTAGKFNEIRFIKDARDAAKRLARG